MWRDRCSHFPAVALVVTFIIRGRGEGRGRAACAEQHTEREGHHPGATKGATRCHRCEQSLRDCTSPKTRWPWTTAVSWWGRAPAARSPVYDPTVPKKSSPKSAAGPTGPLSGQTEKFTSVTSDDASVSPPDSYRRGSHDPTRRAGARLGRAGGAALMLTGSAGALPHISLSRMERNADIPRLVPANFHEEDTP